MKKKTADSFTEPTDDYDPREWEINYGMRHDTSARIVGPAWKAVRPFNVYVVTRVYEEMPSDVLAVFDHDKAAEDYVKAYKLVHRLENWEAAIEQFELRNN